ncbi:MAG TPA: Wzz/FepE/Etk N-terminal domain-containing protein, partial [Polyangiaceae bacterium]|nr:Wzz/FepE/Etk N-terminal domain-containing protein [Polyangiaceae bacterium]
MTLSAAAASLVPEVKTEILAASVPKMHSGSDPHITIGGLLLAIRKHKWLAFGVFFVTLASTIVFLFTQTRIYRASASVQIDPHAPQPLGRGVESVVEMGTSSYWATQEYYKTQHEIIASKSVAQAVVRELDLRHDTAFMANSVVAPPADTEYTEQQATQALRTRLSVNPTKDSRLVEITVDDADQRRAVRLLDALLRAYIAHNLNKAVDSTTSAVQWLGEQLQELQKELEHSELSLHQYKLKKHIPSLGIEGQTGILKQEMEQLSEARTEVRTKIQEASAKLAQLNKIHAEGPESLPQLEQMASAQLQLLRSQYLESMSEAERL